MVHMVQLFYKDVENGLKLMPRLTYDHIKLKSYSTMGVSLAAQSSIVAAVNSRPLMYDYSNPVEDLTPAHIIHGRITTLPKLQDNEKKIGITNWHYKLALGI